MTYKDVLLVADDTPEGGKRAQYAIRLAARHEAHVMGMMLRADLSFAGYAGADVFSANLDAQREAENGAHARVREGFEKRAKAEGVPHEWHSTEGDPVRTVSLFSRHADVAVIGQSGRDGAAFGTSRDLAEHVVLASGRPVIVVPRFGEFPKAGERVMVAWDASREAARAVADALPVLQRAEQVLTFSVDPEERGDRHGPIPGADLARHLARHGVNVKVEKLNAPDVPISDLILNRISDEGIDLLVMGAYGHARVRELWFGGVTRDLMQRMTVPVLLSH